MIHFKKADSSHQAIIFEWLEEPHVTEFWDNSQAHKDDILNFINGRKTPSNYFDGNFSYWIGYVNNDPCAFIMTIKENPGEDRPDIKNQYISLSGTTYSIDYMIGNKNYLGKGLGAEILNNFTIFFKTQIDPMADTFFIDPNTSNPRAKRVYEKAGFKYIGDFLMDDDGVFSGLKSHFLVKKLS